MTEEQKNKKVPIEFTEPKDGAPYLYANYVQVQPTQYDVRIIFGEVIDVNDARVVVQKRANVTVSWLEANVIQQILSAQLKGYEEKNGPLKYKPEMIGGGPDAELVDGPGDVTKLSQHE